MKSDKPREPVQKKEAPACMEEAPVHIKQETEASYADMLNLPHPVSKTHPQMPLADRAAQFAAFAALKH